MTRGDRGREGERENKKHRQDRGRKDVYVDTHWR